MNQSKRKISLSHVMKNRRDIYVPGHVYHGIEELFRVTERAGFFWERDDERQRKRRLKNALTQGRRTGRIVRPEGRKGEYIFLI